MSEQESEGSTGGVPRSGTRAILLDTAERMFAEHGFDGISLRQIGLATGQGNTAVVQYHFGSKKNLIREVMLRRMERFEQPRWQLLDEVAAAGAPWDLVGILKVLYLPFTEALSSEPRCLSARLNLHYQMSDYQPPLDPLMAGPSRVRAFEMLHERLPFLPREELNRRVLNLMGMLCVALLDRRRRAAENASCLAPEPEFFTNLFATLSMMIQVPAATAETHS